MNARLSSFNHSVNNVVIRPASKQKRRYNDTLSNLENNQLLPQNLCEEIAVTDTERELKDWRSASVAACDSYKENLTSTSLQRNEDFSERESHPDSKLSMDNEASNFKKQWSMLQRKKDIPDDLYQIKMDSIQIIDELTNNISLQDASFFRPWKKDADWKMINENCTRENKWKCQALANPFRRPKKSRHSLRRDDDILAQSAAENPSRTDALESSKHTERLKELDCREFSLASTSYRMHKQRAHRASPLKPIERISTIHTAEDFLDDLTALPLRRPSLLVPISARPSTESCTLLEQNELLQQRKPMTSTDKKPNRLSAMNTLAEIKRGREQRRTRQKEEKRLKELDIRQNGDDTSYKFRRFIKAYRAQLVEDRISMASSHTKLPPLQLSSSNSLFVLVRKRPLAKKEVKHKGYDIITCSDTLQSSCMQEIVCHEPIIKVDCTESIKNHSFYFDRVFDEQVDNSQVYEASVGPLIPYLVGSSLQSRSCKHVISSKHEAAVDSTSVTIFAYGQTGSGKTYTMKAIHRRAAADLFRQLEDESNGEVDVHASFYEIYKNHVNDLLHRRRRVQTLEDGEGTVQIVGLTERKVSSAASLLHLIECGEESRSTSANAIHDSSSRSHAVLRITLQRASNGRNPSTGSSHVMSRFLMVDLAGSERASDTQTDAKSTRLEGAEINKSLLALKECIRALNRRASHIPFRQSKLTQLLRDSFLGHNSKTTMIATISPCSDNCNHTLNTLRYADRLKEIGKG